MLLPPSSETVAAMSSNVPPYRSNFPQRGCGVAGRGRGASNPSSSNAKPRMVHVFFAKRTISSETVPIKRRRSPKDTVEPVQDQVTEPHTTPRCRRMDGPSTQSYNAIDAKDVATARKNARRSSTTPQLPRHKPTLENTTSGTSGKSKTRIETD